MSFSVKEYSCFRTVRVLLGIVLVTCLQRIFFDSVLQSSLNSASKQRIESVSRKIPITSGLDPVFNISCLRIVPKSRSQESSRLSSWQLHQEGNTQIYVYSAFYDNRPAAGNKTWLRLLVVASNFKDGYCQIWYPGADTVYGIKAVVHKTGRGDKYKGRQFDQLQLSCEIPRSPIPAHVSISVEPCRQSGVFMPVHVPEQDTQDFAICVPVAFGRLDNDQIIEWAELSRKLGVSKVHVYNATIDRQHDALFRYYEQQDFMAVHQMPPPVPMYTKAGAKLGSPASLNDCMLRNMYTYRYIIVVDFDEVIVPHEDTDYRTLLRAIDTKNNRTANWQSYTFRNLYFFKDFPADTSQEKHLSTLQYRIKVNVSGASFGVKSFVDPRRCLSLFNHYCYIRFRNKNPFTVDVSPKFATSHHYKFCNFKNSECAKMMATNKTDDIMLRYRDYLLQQTSEVKKTLTHWPEGDTNVIVN